MENIITVPRKRRSGMMYAGSSLPEEGDKRSELVHQTEETGEQCEITTKEEHHRSLKVKWNRLSQKIILNLGAKEMAALCQELEVVGSSEELSSVMHSGGTKTIGTTAAEILSLQAQVEELNARNAELQIRVHEVPETAPKILSLQAQLEELNARNAELETRIEEISEIAYIDAQTAKATELELESALQNSMALEQEIHNMKNEDELQSKIIKQSTMIEYYETTAGDMKTRIDELEDRLAATSSNAPRVDSCGKAIEDENLLNELLVDNRRLKSDLDRAHSQLEFVGTQLDWEVEKKEAVMGELMVFQNQKAIYDATKAELVELRKMKRMFEGENAELVELRNLKATLEAERDELAALRSLKGTLEVERDELAALRCQKKKFEAAHAENVLKAAEELQTTRTRKETLQAAIEEVSGLRELKATCEAVTEEHITALRRTKASFETAATEELAALRKQIAFFGTMAEELEELRKQTGISKAEKEELESLRREIEILRAAHGKSASFPDFESAMTAKEENVTARVERLLQKQAKLVCNIKYLEGKRMEDKQEHERYCLELEAARMKLHLMCVDLKAAEQQLLSVIQEKEKEKERLCEDKIHMLSEKEVLEVEKNCLLEEKQNLEQRLHQANKEVINLRLEIERMEKAMTRVKLESTALTRELFVKEAKTESLKAELRLKEEHETEQVRKLKEELVTVTKQLDDVAAEALCHICLENTRDAVLLPCAHMQGCVRCVQELIQRGKSCPNCNRVISGFVFCNFNV